MADIKFEKTTTGNEKEYQKNSTLSDKEIAEGAVQTEVSVDGEILDNKVLPEQLVKMIQREQKKAQVETEEEIRASLRENQGNRNSDSTSNTTKYNSSRVVSVTGTQAVPEMQMDYSIHDKNVKINVNPQIDEQDFPNQDIETSHSGTQTATRDSSRQSENTQEVQQEGEMQPSSSIPNFNDRDALRADIANRARGNTNLNNGSAQNNSSNQNLNDGVLQDITNNVDEGAPEVQFSQRNTRAGAAAAGATIAGAAVAGSRARRSGGGTAGRPAAITEEEQYERNVQQSMRRGARMAGTAVTQAGKAGKAVTTAMKTKKLMTLGAIIGTVGVLAIILLLVVGALSFVLNMPGMVRDKIVDTFDSLWQQAKGLLVGQDQPSDIQVKKLAEYLQDMGYDLKYNGFATELEAEKDGTIKDIESKYLAAYIAAEQRNYMIANENHSVKSIWKGVTSLFEDGKNTDFDEPWGTGMIAFESDLLHGLLSGAKNLEKIVGGVFGEGAGEAVGNLNPINYLAKITDNIYDFCTGRRSDVGNKVADLSPLSARIIVKRDTKEIYLSKYDLRDMYNTGGYDVYRYSLKEWTERYGTPTELFLTLHLATRAPEFAFKFATTYDTKVFLQIKELENVQIDVMYAETNPDNTVRLDENGKPIMVSLTGMSTAQIKEEIKKHNPKLQGVTDETITELKSIPNKITAFTPYITAVMNHWYYDQIIYQGTYNGKKIDVYEPRNLEPGQPGYERYYAYTRRDNSDTPVIENASQNVDPKSGWLGQMINFAIMIVKAYLTGGTSLIYDTVCDEIKGQVVDVALDEVQGMLPEELVNGFDGMTQFYQNGFNWDNWSGNLSLGNMSDILDFDKMTDFMSIDNLKLNTEDLLGELNLGDQLMNMDLGGIGSINDLDKMLTNFPSNLQNLETAFTDGFTNIIDFSNTNLDSFANIMSSGISLDSISGIQDSFLDLFDKKMFVGLTEMEYGKFSNELIDGVSKQISDITSSPMLNQLDGAISKAVSGELANGMFDEGVLTGLQNEFSKQVTGMSYDKLKGMAEIPDLDFNQIKSLSNQVTGLSSTLGGAANSIENLGAKANQISTQITGLDTQVLNSVANGFKAIDKDVTDIGSNIGKTKELLTNGKVTGSNVKAAVNKIDTLERQIKDLENATNKLNIDDIERLQREIESTKNDLTRTINAIDNIDDKTLRNITSEVSKVENTANRLVNNIKNLDKVSAKTVVYKLEKIDKTGLVDLATDLYNLDVSNNDMLKYVNNYITDVSGLKTTDINLMMDAINGKNVSAQKAIDRVSKYLLRDGAEAEVRGYLRDLNSTVNLIEDYTVNLDTRKIMQLADKVVDFDSSALNVFAKQINKLENASIDKLLNQVEKLPNKVMGQVKDMLTEKITDGIKDKLASTVSGNIKDKLLGTNNFSNVFKSRLTAGEQFEGMDPEAEDGEVEDPDSEYATGFYIREIRTSDYFQVAEPVRVLRPASHWKKVFLEDKYVILDSAGIDLKRLDDEVYVLQHGKSIWEATQGNIEEAIYAMLQGIQSADSQYLYRYFKELFNDFDWIFDGSYGVSKKDAEPDEVNEEAIGWLFKTVKSEEITYVGDKIEVDSYECVVTEEQVQAETPLKEIAKSHMPDDADYYEYQVYEKWFTSDCDLEVTYYKYINPQKVPVEKAEYEPYVWPNTQIGIINSKKQDPVYGFKEGMDIVAPANGVVVSKTNASKNELGQSVAESITIEFRNTGDENLDGMRLILIGGDYSTLNVGSLVRKVTYTLDEEGNYIGDTSVSVIGTTKDEPIKVMLLDKDQTPVKDISKYIYPPYEKHEAVEKEGDEVNGNQSENTNTVSQQ